MIATPETMSARKRSSRRAWVPKARDHFLYRLVRFEGHTQEEAAGMQRVSQATVSRVLQRYERWQAHAEEREGGQLDPAEQLRMQRWLTYERNELIVASSLRIAKKVEGVTQLRATVYTRPEDGHDLRRHDVERTVDRIGIAARYLRLAFRVNMEQLALVQQELPPRPQPLSEEELEREALADAAADAELDAVEREREEHYADFKRRALQEYEAAEQARLAAEAAARRGSQGPAESSDRRSPAAPLSGDLRSDACAGSGDPRTASGDPRTVERTAEPEVEPPLPVVRRSGDPQPPDELAAESETPAVMHHVHKMHNAGAEKTAASAAAACTCAENAAEENFVEEPCITLEPNPPDYPAAAPSWLTAAAPVT